MTARPRLALLALLTALVLPVHARAQAAAQPGFLPGSRVWVDGKSNKSEFTVKAGAVSGFVTLQPGKANELKVQAGRFSVASGEMVSERSVIMDRLMWGALKSEQHPTITYELVSAQATPDGAGKFKLATKGRLTIAGVTKEIEGAAQGERRADGSVRFTGSYPLLMTDYGMTPPTAMFGALRTMDQVVVNYELLVKP